jgi:hypothetical protein
MLVFWSLHNIRNLEIYIKGIDQLFALVDCEEFKMIRHPHIYCLFDHEYYNLEKSDDNIEPEDAGKKYVLDVFKAFPDV